MSRRRHFRRARRRALFRPTAARCCLFTAEIPPAGSDFIPDAEAVNALHYTVALHASKIQMHGIRFAGPSFHLMFTPPTADACADFLDAVYRDFSGYLCARFGWPRFCFGVEMELLMNTGAVLEATLWVRHGVPRGSIFQSTAPAPVH